MPVTDLSRPPRLGASPSRRRGGSPAGGAAAPREVPHLRVVGVCHLPRGPAARPGGAGQAGGHPVGAAASRGLSCPVGWMTKRAGALYEGSGQTPSIVNKRLKELPLGRHRPPGALQGRGDVLRKAVRCPRAPGALQGAGRGPPPPGPSPPGSPGPVTHPPQRGAHAVLGTQESVRKGGIGGKKWAKR